MILTPVEAAETRQDQIQRERGFELFLKHLITIKMQFMQQDICRKW